MRKVLLTPVVLAAGVALVVSGCCHSNPGSFDVDTKYHACDDFADYVNARWNAANPIPADQTTWDSYGVLAEQSRQNQKQILEAAAQGAQHDSGSDLQRKLGDLYAAGMDTETIDKLGYDPIKPQLAAVDALTSPADVVDFINTRHNEGDSYVFKFSAGADFTDATKQIGYVNQAGLSLPTPDYYTQPAYQDIRDAFLAHVAKSLELVGTPAADAKTQADQVLAFETSLARASLSPTEMRDPDNHYNFISVAEADAISPHFSWTKFFTAQGVDVGEGFSLSQPKFIAEFDRLLATAPVAQWQAYLRYALIDNVAAALSQPFRDNHFDFYGTTLNGQPQQNPRWTQVVSVVNAMMGMGLGQLYVARYFPPDAKARAEQLVATIQAALRSRIENLTWMSEATKRKALEKLALFLSKIGYPDDDHWPSFSGLTIQPGQWYADLAAAVKYNYHGDLDDIGKPTDRMDWSMTPQTVNAYYEGSTNTINFPAAILQPPFFYADGDDALNYGGIGWVIGHELTHGFDDQGSQFDGYGNRVNWWTPEDRQAFNDRAAALISQFDAYTPIPGKPDLHVNGKLTLSENIADLGGLNIAYDALQAALRANRMEANTNIDGLTQAQRFFFSSARTQEGTTREREAELALNTDTHSPHKIRAFASATNMPQFAQTFACRPGDPMVHTGKELVVIW